MFKISQNVMILKRQNGIDNFFIGTFQHIAMAIAC
jgi:hypothetical protein